MAVERGLYKPGTDAYQKTLVEMKRGFDPDKYSKVIGINKDSKRFIETFEAIKGLDSKFEDDK